MKKITLAALSAMAAGIGVKRIWKEKYSAENLRADENEALAKVYYHWLLYKQCGGDFARYLGENGFRKIAVFGMSPLGRRFAEEFRQDMSVKIVYAIECGNPGAVHPDFDVLRLGDDPLSPVDAVIVCQTADCESICAKLREEIGDECRILTLSEVITGALTQMGLGPRDGVLL